MFRLARSYRRSSKPWRANDQHDLLAVKRAVNAYQSGRDRVTEYSMRVTTLMLPASLACRRSASGRPQCGSRPSAALLGLVEVQGGDGQVLRQLRDGLVQFGGKPEDLLRCAADRLAVGS